MTILAVYFLYGGLSEITGLEWNGVSKTSCGFWKILTIEDKDTYVLFKLAHGNIFEIDIGNIAPNNTRMGDIELNIQSHQYDYVKK